LALRALRFGRGGLFLLGAEDVALVLLVGLEIGLVPAAPLQAEHRRRHQLLQAALAARRTAAERGIGDLLHDLGVELAGLALVLVNGHLGCCLGRDDCEDYNGLAPRGLRGSFHRRAKSLRSGRSGALPPWRTGARRRGPRCGCGRPERTPPGGPFAPAASRSAAGWAASGVT